MGKSLVIVESKAKASTINKILGRGFTVKASIGHVRDLPKKKLGIDTEDGFKPTYITIRGKGKVLKELKEAARKSDVVYLASDFDREGEAIAWHIAELLKLPAEKVRRVVFNEITKGAILSAMEHPGEIDMNKVDAQQARRVLDRLVGYEVSPVLWKTIYYGLSAGRVQSVALRLICEREDEIEAFVPEEYWTIDAVFVTDKGDEIEGRLERIDGKIVRITEAEQAHAIVELLAGKDFHVASLKQRTRKVNPFPPFITSTLQRAAANRLRFTSKKTMMLAQQLYEGLPIDGENVGLITYMRTDSTRMAGEAVSEARDHIVSAFGKEYRAEKPRHYRTKKGAQDAHEAVRPTSVARTPESLKSHLSTDQFRLYQLIWRRFLATQMAPAVYENTTLMIEADGHAFKATGSVVAFPGFSMALACIRFRRQDRHQGTARSQGGRGPEPEVHGCEPALHEAAGPLLGGHAHQGARVEGHRTPEHLRGYRGDAQEEKIRVDRQTAVRSDGAGTHRVEPPRAGFLRYLQRGFHGADGKRAGQSRVRRGRVGGRRGRSRRSVEEPTG